MLVDGVVEERLPRVQESAGQGERGRGRGRGGGAGGERRWGRYSYYKRSSKFTLTICHEELITAVL